MEFEIFFKKYTFPLAPKEMKYLGIILTKYIKDLYEENYKTTMRDIKEETKWLERYSIFMDRKTQYRQDVSSSQFDL